MQIRLAIKKDMESLVNLWIELMEYHAPYGEQFLVDKNKRTAIESFMMELLSKKHNHIYVMESGETIIALLIARIEQRPEMFLHAKSGYIAESVVTKAYQRKGIGNELTNAALAWFREEQVTFSELQVSIQNDKAIAFWKSKGYETQVLRMVRAKDN